MAQFNYRVEFENFAQKHYIKKFEKKYGDKWIATEQVITSLCERNLTTKRNS